MTLSLGSVTANCIEGLKERMLHDYGSLVMLKYEECLIAFTPVADTDNWTLISYIPLEYISSGTIDYILVGFVTAGLLIFDLVVMLLFNRQFTVTAKNARAANQAKTYFLSTIMIPAFVCDIADIDVNEGIRRCGSAEAFLGTARTFAETIPQTAEDIAKYRAADDLKNITVKVHAVKSSSRVIGAMKLGEHAERLENSGNENDGDTVYAEL